MCSGVILVRRFVRMFLYNILKDRLTSTDVTGEYCKSATIVGE